MRYNRGIWGRSTYVQVLKQVNFGLQDIIEHARGGVNSSMRRTMICPISLFGMLLSCISFMATVSPVAQFNAPAEFRQESARFRVVWRTYGTLVRTRPCQGSHQVAVDAKRTSQSHIRLQSSL